MLVTCSQCSAAAAMMTVRGSRALPWCNHHLNANRDALIAQGWHVTTLDGDPVAPSVSDVDRPAPPVASEPVADAPFELGGDDEVTLASVDTPFGVIDEYRDTQGRLHDRDEAPAYRRFDTGRDQLLEFRHYQHGVCTRTGLLPTWCMYDIDPTQGRYLSFVARHRDGALTDVTDQGRHVYAMVTLDVDGNALRIESWSNGQFQQVVDPRTLPGA